MKDLLIAQLMTKSDGTLTHVRLYFPEDGIFYFILLCVRWVCVCSFVSQWRSKFTTSLLFYFRRVALV